MTGPQGILCFPYSGEFRRYPNYMALFLQQFTHRGSGTTRGLVFDLLGNSPEPLSAVLDELAPSLIALPAPASLPGGK